MLKQLLSLLEPQIQALGLRKFEQVDVLIQEDQSAMLYGDPAGVGDSRESLRRLSSGEYICFLDDDDLIAPDYVSTILPLLDGIDQVGFEVKAFRDHEPIAPTIHSLACGNWSEETGFAPGTSKQKITTKYLRDISHINPMRRDLALACPMSGGVGEDHRWADGMRKTGLVRTEHYISSGPMYFYLWRTRKNDVADARDPWRLEMIEKLRYIPSRG